MLEKRTVRGPSKLDAERLWEYALRALGTRALSAGELRARLRRRALTAGDVESAMARLKEYGYIDDRAFAETFAAAREGQGLGKARVIRDLRQRQVAAGTAAEAADKAFEGADEAELIERFLARKYRGVDLSAAMKDEKKLASAFRRLRYAGFSAANCVRVLRRHSERAVELEEEEGEE